MVVTVVKCDFYSHYNPLMVVNSDYSVFYSDYNGDYSDYSDVNSDCDDYNGATSIMVVDSD